MWTTPGTTISFALTLLAALSSFIPSYIFVYNIVRYDNPVYVLAAFPWIFTLQVASLAGLLMLKMWGAYIGISSHALFLIYLLLMQPSIAPLIERYLPPRHDLPSNSFYTLHSALYVLLFVTPVAIISTLALWRHYK
jgi:hypothetical protein